MEFSLSAENSLEWIAAALTLIGIRLYPTRLTEGILVSIAGSVLWIGIGLNAQLYGMAALNAALIVTHLWNGGKHYYHRT